MDRIEFIELLNDKVTKQEEIKNDLISKKNDAFYNSMEYLRKMLEEPKKDNTNTLHASKCIDLGQCYDMSAHIRPKEKNTTRIIIEISHKLCVLEEECALLESQIATYESDSIDKALPMLMLKGV